jgi:V/A-type H+-transporting ATPase subunit A
VIEGKIVRISGPIVRAEGLGSAGLYDVVEVGESRLIGEIVRIEGDAAVVQVYEDDTGLAIGSAARSIGRPLSVLLGPGLIGTYTTESSVPYGRSTRRAGHSWLPASGRALGPGQEMALRSQSRSLPAPFGWRGADGRFGGSARFGAGDSPYRLRRHGPPSAAGKTLAWLAPEGEYTVRDVVARTADGVDICLAQWWPVRIARPYARKLTVDEPLVTGQRVIDVFFPLSKGGTAAIPGGFGTGKTMTQHAVAKWCDADVIVYIGCGERGNEMTDVLTEFPELVDPGPAGP